MCNCARLSAAVYVLGLCGYRCADGCSCMKCPQGEGRAWACTPAVCWGGVVCWYLRCVCSLCLYAGVCVCVCVCVFITGPVYVFGYVCGVSGIHVYVCVCMHECMYVHEYMCICMCT